MIVILQCTKSLYRCSLCGRNWDEYRFCKNKIGSDRNTDTQLGLVQLSDQNHLIWPLTQWSEHFPAIFLYFRQLGKAQDQISADLYSVILIFHPSSDPHCIILSTSQNQHGTISLTTLSNLILLCYVILL